MEIFSHFLRNLLTNRKKKSIIKVQATRYTDCVQDTFSDVDAYAEQSAHRLWHKAGKQACAVLPGLSRSGSTIATGLLLGDNKAKLAQFSFLMVIPPILGEALLDSVKMMKGEDVVGDIPALSLIVGFLAAFVAGCLACKWMINIVKKGKLIYFAIYCAIAGLAVIITQL